ncbi:hypothetical protein BKA69DRAFT_576269 [Paraphysoderma sedebokerense]|nr:hypothetical protein BKA69DRAFT_576269 [Paraphysoderma sedebokerense]
MDIENLHLRAAEAFRRVQSQFSSLTSPPELSHSTEFRAKRILQKKHLAIYSLKHREKRSQCCQRKLSCANFRHFLKQTASSGQRDIYRKSNNQPVEIPYPKSQSKSQKNVVLATQITLDEGLSVAEIVKCIQEEESWNPSVVKKSSNSILSTKFVDMKFVVSRREATVGVKSCDLQTLEFIYPTDLATFIVQTTVHSDPHYTAAWVLHKSIESKHLHATYFVEFRNHVADVPFARTIMKRLVARKCVAVSKLLIEFLQKRRNRLQSERPVKRLTKIASFDTPKTKTKGRPRLRPLIFPQNSAEFQSSPCLTSTGVESPRNIIEFEILEDSSIPLSPTDSDSSKSNERIMQNNIPLPAESSFNDNDSQGLRKLTSSSETQTGDQSLLLSSVYFGSNLASKISGAQIIAFVDSSLSAISQQRQQLLLCTFVALVSSMSI